MDLGEYLFEIAATYDRLDGLKTPAQQMLKDAGRLLAEHAPHGATIIGSGGKGMATYTPWVGFFDPDETDTPQRGIYIVYLFTEDLEQVVLTLNQGMEYLRRELGDADARTKLAADADAIRTALIGDDNLDHKWLTPMDLRSSGNRQKAYTAGNIASITYDTAELPDEAVLRDDLAELHDVYAQAITTKRHLLMAEPGTISTPSTPQVNSEQHNPFAGFRPKSADDYRARIEGRELVKTRRHERLVNDFAQHCRQLGHTATTPHPCDLVIATHTDKFLVEAKTVYNHNATDAVRATVGQLLSYSYFLHPNEGLKLVALFNEPIGDAYVEFLTTVGIASIWWDAGWKGTDTAADELISRQEPHHGISGQNP